MKILVIVDPQIPVPPVSYGGTERIAAYLCDGLSESGHTVDLIAGPGSKSFGGALHLHRAPSLSRSSRAYRKLRFFVLSYLAALNADLVINHGRLDYLSAILRTRIPVIHVQHNPVSESENTWILSRRQAGLRLIAVSAAQISHLATRDLWRVIPNATRLADIDLVPTPRVGDPYLAFLGRITWNKGADTAIRVARRCGLRLKLAGNISDEEGGREFFEKEIRSQLDSQIEWIGPVDDEAKQQLLAGAEALLFPIRWPEPFGIVMAESLACGTPVIAMQCASTPEVIDDEITGFLCADEAAMVEAVTRLPELDRTRCREAAVARFSPLVMAANYLRIVEELLEEARPPRV